MDDAVFICYSSDDKLKVRALCDQLRRDGVRYWLDEVDLLPGQKWRHEISRAIRASPHVLVCLSASSVQKRGYVQTEIYMALEAEKEQPEGANFLIPVKLGECDLPDSLRPFQSVSLVEPAGYDRLRKVLRPGSSANADPLPPEDPPIVTDGLIIKIIDQCYDVDLREAL